MFRHGLDEIRYFGELASTHWHDPSDTTHGNHLNNLCTAGLKGHFRYNSVFQDFDA